MFIVNRALTHDGQPDDVALAVSLHVAGQTRIVARLLSLDVLKCQVLLIHNHAAFHVSLDHLTLRVPEDKHVYFSLLKRTRRGRRSASGKRALFIYHRFHPFFIIIIFFFTRKIDFGTRTSYPDGGSRGGRIR